MLSDPIRGFDVPLSMAYYAILTCVFVVGGKANVHRGKYQRLLTFLTKKSILFSDIFVMVI